MTGATYPNSSDWAQSVETFKHEMDKLNFRVDKFLHESGFYINSSGNDPQNSEERKQFLRAVCNLCADIVVYWTELKSAQFANRLKVPFDPLVLKQLGRAIESYADAPDERNTERMREALSDFKQEHGILADFLNSVLEDGPEWTEPLEKAFLCQVLPMNKDELRAALDNGTLREKPNTGRQANKIQLDPACLFGTCIESQDERTRLHNEFIARRKKSV